MHYPHKISKVKRARKLGFRARMRTRNGRKMINRKRSVGRKVQVV
jgi:large subunit ribosomal protein L34